MPSLICNYLGGQQEYIPVWKAMQTFTQERSSQTEDELWLLEHCPVFTLGRAGREEHILNNQSIPVIRSDRGGQVTYHGPGQIVAYPLFNLSRLKLSIREFVGRLEKSIMHLLKLYGIQSRSDENAPGVYVDEKKIASIGLRVRHGYSYHGISLNVRNDLSPFQQINPCGYPGLQVTNMSKIDPATNIDAVRLQLIDSIAQQFGYTTVKKGSNH